MLTEPKDFSDVLSRHAGGVRVTVRAKPGLSRTRAIKIADIGDGKRAVEVSVAAEAREGKANAALIERMAGEWGLNKKQIHIQSGKTGRIKIVEIAGDPEALMRKLAKLF